MNEKSIIIKRNNGFLPKFCMLLTAIQLILLALCFHNNSLNENRHLFITLSCSTIVFAALALLSNKKTCFLRIENNNLQICRKQENLEDISIPINEISRFETRFNKIIIYDNRDNVYSVNLDHIQSNQKRWEIKETLRKLFPCQLQQKAS